MEKWDGRGAENGAEVMPLTVATETTKYGKWCGKEKKERKRKENIK